MTKIHQIYKKEPLEIPYEAQTPSEIQPVKPGTTLPTSDQKNQHQPANAIFSKAHHQKKKMLDYRPPYSARDVQLEMLALQHQATSGLTTQLKIKKYMSLCLNWTFSVCASFLALNALNVAADLYFSSSLSAHQLLLSSALLSSLSAFAFQCLHKNKAKTNAATSKATVAVDEPLLTEMITHIAAGFDIKSPLILFTLNPTISLVEKNKALNITLGLPLFSTLSNHELITLLIFRFHEFSLQKSIKTMHWLPLGPLQSELLYKMTNTSKLARALNKIQPHPWRQDIELEAIAQCIKTVDKTTFISALEKYLALNLSYQRFLKAAKTKDLSPLNAVTQIACGSETVDIRDDIKQLKVEQRVKQRMATRDDSTEIFHNQNQLIRCYGAQWLLKNPNAAADIVSRALFLSFDFTVEQINKTHNTHAAFPSLTDKDRLQHYFGGLYRTNRVILPDLKDAEVGALTVLKSELQQLNTTITKQRHLVLPFLQLWDQHLTPQIQRQEDPANSLSLERAHIELCDLESMLSKKIGFCLAIHLSIGSPQEQLKLYELLDARRKADHLKRAMDALLSACKIYSQEQSIHNGKELRNARAIVEKLANFLPNFNQQVMPLKTSNILLENLKYIETLDQYRWHLEVELIQHCQKVEDRMGVTPIGPIP